MNKRTRILLSIFLVPIQFWFGFAGDVGGGLSAPISFLFTWVIGFPVTVSLLPFLFAANLNESLGSVYPLFFLIAAPFAVGINYFAITFINLLIIRLKRDKNPI